MGLQVGTSGQDMRGKGQPHPPALTAEELEVLERPLKKYSGFMCGDTNANLTNEATQLMHGERSQALEGFGREDSGRPPHKNGEGLHLYLCMDPEADDPEAEERSMARIDSTINLGFAGRVRFQAAGRSQARSFMSSRSHLCKRRVVCRTSRRLSRRSWQSSKIRSILALFLS